MYIPGSPPPKSIRGGSISRFKKGKKHASWGSRERAGMSFLIVIVFFAVFGLIILTEVLMIDDKNRNANGALRHIGVNSRFAESVPDYDDVKDDYMDDPNIFVREQSKFGAGMLKGLFQKNVKPQPDLNFGQPGVDSISAGGANTAVIPWGQMLNAKVEESLPGYPVGMKPTDGAWQIVNGTRYKFFVFSAFYDRRDGRLIRVVGATKTRGPEKVWCRLWYPLDANNTRFRSTTIMARVKVIRENWNLKYSACFVLCPLRTASLKVPYSVSVVSKLKSPPGHILLVRNADWDVDYANRSVTNDVPHRMAVCVKPLHFDYDNALHLLEFIELNAILGVTHFTLYNHTIGPKAACVLRHYMHDTSTMTLNVSASTNGGAVNASDYTITSDSRPRITVNLLPWNLRMRSQKEIRTEGLFAALNDCLYRSMYRFAHVALIDLDEFIVPRHNDTLIDLISWLSQRITSRSTGAYSFQNAFFYLQFADDSLMYSEKSSNPSLRGALITQRKTRRRAKLHPQKQRSKYIAKPEAVIEAGNHFVWEFRPGRGSLNVPADSAILHHYRVCEFGGDDCIKSPSVVDRTAHRYSQRLLDRVGAIYEHLKEPCNLADLPPPPTKPPAPRPRVLRIRSKNATANTPAPTASKLQVVKSKASVNSFLGAHN